MSLDYKVIASGSTGNAVRIENVMIDCGIAYKKLKDDLYNCDYLLLTHIHGDHIKKTCFDSIKKNFPNIKIYANADVAYNYPIDKVIGTKPFDLSENIHVIPYEGHHDVPVTYFILQINDQNVFYATDTNKVDNPEEIPIDYCFLEANYDEQKMEYMKKYRTASYDPIEGALRHLSKQKCREFYFVNRRSAESKLIELHKSRRFY